MGQQQDEEILRMEGQSRAVQEMIQQLVDASGSVRAEASTAEVAKAAAEDLAGEIREASQQAIRRAVQADVPRETVDILYGALQSVVEKVCQHELTLHHNFNSQLGAFNATGQIVGKLTADLASLNSQLSTFKRMQENPESASEEQLRKVGDRPESIANKRKFRAVELKAEEDVG